MRRRALLTIGWLGVTTGLGFVGCSESATQSPGPTAGASGEGGEGMPAGAGGGGNAGGSRGGSGGSANRGGSATGGGSSGGAAGESTGGTRSGTGGANGATGGTSGGKGGTSGVGGTDGPGGGGAGGGPPDPVICDRLGAVVAGRLADPVAVAFERAYYMDCRLAWFSTLYLPPVNQRERFLNGLRSLTLDLWGCRDMPPTRFSLIHSDVPLSGAEVHELIQDYMTVMVVEAQLSPSEVAIVRRELEELAAPLIDSNLADFSRSRCPDDGGGGQGGAGDPGGAAGLGGGG